jgi:hypothetical protein
MESKILARRKNTTYCSARKRGCPPLRARLLGRRKWKTPSRCSRGVVGPPSTRTTLPAQQHTNTNTHTTNTDERFSRALFLPSHGNGRQDSPYGESLACGPRVNNIKRTKGQALWSRERPRRTPESRGTTGHGLLLVPHTRPLSLFPPAGSKATQRSVHGERPHRAGCEGDPDETGQGELGASSRSCCRRIVHQTRDEGSREGWRRNVDAGARKRARNVRVRRGLKGCEH